jgi:D-apionolactonase
MTSDNILAAPSRTVKLCGTDTADPAMRRLSAGKLSVELENVQLRYVRFGGVEALRGIAFLVRDENWST